MMVGHDLVRRLCSKNNLQLKSDWKLSTNVLAVQTSVGDFRGREIKERTIKETVRAEHAKLRLTLFKGICFDFINVSFMVSSKEKYVVPRGGSDGQGNF